MEIIRMKKSPVTEEFRLFFPLPYDDAKGRSREGKQIGETKKEKSESWFSCTPPEAAV